MIYNLYRTSMTGVVEWRYTAEKETGNLLEQAQVFISGPVTSQFPLTIYSHQFGAISSSFDTETSCLPGAKRYGENEQGDLVLCLEWQESHYDLLVVGYPLFVVRGLEFCGRRSYRITANEDEVASLKEVRKQAVENGAFEPEVMMQLQVEAQYVPLAEIFASLPALMFFPLTEEVYSPNSFAMREAGIKPSPLVKKALKLCFEAHKEQTDKGGIPYVFHPFHIAETMPNEESVLVALLHDVVEDTDYTLEDLRDEGFPPNVVEAVALLTHDKAVPYLEYIKAIKYNPLARRVKLADLRHNSTLSRIDAADKKAMERIQKYAQAMRILEPMHIETKDLYKRCYMLSEDKQIIDLSHLPFKDGYYVTEEDIVLKVEKYSVYRLEVDIWVPDQSFISLWYDSMTNFADIPPSIVKELGLENATCEQPHKSKNLL